MSRFAKLWPALLAISVLLNVFVLGWVAVRIARRGPPAREHHESAMPSAARRVWEEHGPRLRGQRRRIEEQREAVAEALRHEPFDAAALDAKLSELRAATDERDVEWHHALTEVAVRLTPEERQQLSRSRLLLGAGPAPRRAREAY